VRLDGVLAQAFHSVHILPDTYIVRRYMLPVGVPFTRRYYGKATFVGRNSRDLSKAVQAKDRITYTKRKSTTAKYQKESRKLPEEPTPPPQPLAPPPTS